MAFPDTTGVGLSNDRLFIGQNHLICTFLLPDTMEMTSTNQPATPPVRSGVTPRSNADRQSDTRLTAMHLKHADYITRRCRRADVRSHYVRRQHHFFQREKTAVFKLAVTRCSGSFRTQFEVFCILCSALCVFTWLQHKTLFGKLKHG